MGRAPRLAGENCMPISSRPAPLRPIVREFILAGNSEPFLRSSLFWPEINSLLPPAGKSGSPKRKFILGQQLEPSKELQLLNGR